MCYVLVFVLVVFFFLYYLFFVPRNSSFPVNQSGSGATHYSLTKTSRRHIEKFETTSVDYLLKVNNLNVRGFSRVLKTLDGLLTSILSDTTASMADRDQIRFVMHSPQLSNAIS